MPYSCDKLPMNFISLFCGCGGFDLGFIQTGHSCIGAYDIDPVAIEAHRRNLSSIAEIRDLSLQAPPLRLLRKADIVLAGPPCQGFSTAGKRQLNDPRNNLLPRAGEIAIMGRPKVILMENVPAVTAGSHKRYWHALTQILRNAGYQTVELRCDASNMGMGQIRKRIVLLAWRTGRQLDIALGKEPPKSLREILRGIDTTHNHIPTPIDPGSSIDLIANRIGPGQKLCNVRKGIRSVHTWEIPEVYGHTNKNERHILDLFISLRRRNRARTFGDADPITARQLSKSAGHAVAKTLAALIRKGYVRYSRGRYDLTHTFNGKFRRLNWNLPSYTVDTRFGDPRYFLHPDENRGFTVREAARIQGFPDSFVFPGNEKAQYTLVGNAVPPPVGRQLAMLIREGLFA